MRISDAVRGKTVKKGLTILLLAAIGVESAEALRTRRELKEAALSGLLMLIFTAGCMPSPIGSINSEIPIATARATAVLEATATALPTPTAETPLPGGPDQLTQAEIETRPMAIPINKVQAGAPPAGQQAFEVSRERQFNVTKHKQDIEAKLRALGLDKVTLSGYETGQGQDYRWTIAGVTSRGFIHSIIGDQLAGDPGYVSEESSFIELVDGFGPEVSRAWEQYGGVWTPVLRNNQGQLLGVYNFETGKFDLMAGAAETALGVRAEKSVNTGTETLFVNQEGVPVLITNPDGSQVRPEFTQNGKEWVGVVQDELMSWDGAKMSVITLPNGVARETVVMSEAGMFFEKDGKVQEYRKGGWREVRLPRGIVNFGQGSDINMDKPVSEMLKQAKITIMDNKPVIQLTERYHNALLGTYEQGQWQMGDNYHLTVEEIKELQDIYFEWNVDELMWDEVPGKIVADLWGREIIVGVRNNGGSLSFLVMYGAGEKWLEVQPAKIYLKEYRLNDDGKLSDQYVREIENKGGLTWLDWSRLVWLMSGPGWRMTTQLSFYADTRDIIETSVNQATFVTEEIDTALERWESGKFDPTMMDNGQIVIYIWLHDVWDGPGVPTERDN